MAQAQTQADANSDELCPPNKRYALMDTNKKMDLDNPLCPIESKILVDILQNHPLRFNIDASSSVPWIYLGQFWHTLKEDRSKYRLSFMIDIKEIIMTLDYVELLWEGLHYDLEHPATLIPYPRFTKLIVSHYMADHPATLIPYPRFTKLIVSHYMTIFPDISRRARDRYHNMADDLMVKSKFNSGKNKAGPIESTQGTHRTPSAPRTLNLVVQEEVNEGESSAPRKSTVIRFRVPSRRSTNQIPPTPTVSKPILTAAQIKELALQETFEVIIAKQKSREEQEARQNVENVKEHLVEEDIKKMMEGTENEDTENLGKLVEETRNTPSPTTLRSPRIQSTLVSSDTEKLQELMETGPTPSSLPKPTSSMARHMGYGRVATQYGMVDDRSEIQKTQVPIYVAEGLILERQKMQADIDQRVAAVDSFVRSYMSNHILHVHPTQASQAIIHEQQYQLYLTMKDDPQLQHDDISICAKRQKTTKHGTYVIGESSSRQAYKSKPGPSTTGNQEQIYDFDFWTDKYASDNDELPSNKVSQELVKEMSETVDEAKLRKVVEEMMRQRCTSGDEHQYHIDQMQNILKSDIYLAVIFPDDDIEERTSIWVDKCVKKFNPYTRYSVEHWRNPHNEHKFVTEIIVRRENGSIMSITKLDYKNLNKNDLEDMYLLCINGKDFQLGVESYQHNVNFTAPTITDSRIEEVQD
ncbi:hypothetical protein Tco_0889668, partial [Tanacetum coccineum]